MRTNNIKKFNMEFVTNHSKEIQSLPTAEQFDIYEKMLELEGLSPIDSFEAIPAHDLVLNKVTEQTNKWQKINSTISTLQDTVINNEGMFLIMVRAKQALQTITEEFPLVEITEVLPGITEVI